MNFILWFFWLSLFVSQSAMDAGATLLFGAALVTIFRERRTLVKGDFKTGFGGLFLVWIAIVFAGLFFVAPAEAPRWKSLLEYRWMLEWTLWVFLLSRHLPRPSQLGWILGPPLAVALYGLVSYVLGYSPIHGTEIAVTRVEGLFQSSMPFAHTFGPMTALVFGWTLTAWRARAQQSKLLTVAAGILGLAIVLSLTRGVWIGLGLAAILMPPWLERRRGVLLSAVILALGLGAVAGVPALRARALQSFDPARSYDSERVEIWKANFAMFRDSPLIGIGWNENGRRLREYFDRAGLPATQFQGHAHSQYFQALSGTGALGLLCYLLFAGGLLVVTGLALRRGAKDDWWMRGTLLGIWGAQIVFVVGGLTEANFSIAKNRYMYLFLTALALAAIKRRANPTKLSS